MEGDDGPATRLCCQLPEMATTQYFKQVVNPRLCFSSVVVFTWVESSDVGGGGVANCADLGYKYYSSQS